MQTELIRLALVEDAPWGDVTSEAIVPAGVNSKAGFVAREPGVMSGSGVVHEVLRQVDPSIEIESSVTDGERFSAGAVLARVSGDSRSLLRAERVALNFVQRLCGVATITARYVEAVAGTSARIVDTRKTTPGLRHLEKAAVVDGGGRNHRFCLSDAVLVKDNHLAAIGGVGNLSIVRDKTGHLMKIEVEVDALEQIEAALAGGADSILCDNFDTWSLREAVSLVDGRALVNASGGVTLQTVSEIARTGVDLISVGALTHSVRVIDIGLDFDPR